MEKTILQCLYAALLSLSDRLLPRKSPGTPGRPQELGPAETAFLAIVREYHHQMPYRELASSRYARWLGLHVHYTAIQKAIARLPEWFMEEAARIFADIVSSETIDCVVDATEIGIYKYETKDTIDGEKRVQETVKLSACWDADKRVFHGFQCLEGKAHGGKTLVPMVEGIGKKVRKCFADTEFSSRKNIQALADRGVEPVIKPQPRATTRSKGYPAWKWHIRRYRELGYERWRDETGYGKRFENEGAFGALIARFGDQVKARSPRVIPKLLGARMVVHNLFASLVYRA